MIALITDFGLADIYVGVMKSVIQSVSPGEIVVNITHVFPPHDIRSGSFALRGAYPYLPAGTVLVAVVDPGVGSDRMPIAVRSGKSWIIAPNNGLVSGVAFDQAVVLDKPNVHRPGSHSTTFHGRDIFAPAAAHLVLNQDISTIGSPLELKSIVTLDRGTIHRTDTALSGEIQHIDRFGNLITNITPDIVNIWASDEASLTVTCGDTTLPAKRVKTYAEGIGFDGVVLISNSFGLIEIAAANSDASSQLGSVRVGQSVTIKIA